MKNKCRRILVNITGLKSYYFLLSVLCVISAAVILFAAELLRSAVILREITYMPHEDYHLLTVALDADEPFGIKTELGSFGGESVEAFGYFENVLDVIYTEVGTSETELSYFMKNYSRSKRDHGELPWTVTEESEYDADFRDAKRLLVSGRHITKEDVESGSRVALIDTELARLNGLSLGDKFSAGDGGEYEIIGLYKMLTAESAVSTAVDVPNNMIYTSLAPSTLETKLIRDIYLLLDGEYGDDELRRLVSLTLSKYYDSSAFTLVKVSDINKISSRGVSSMLILSLVSAALVLLTAAVAMASMITTLYKKRMREFLLYGALGKKSISVICDYGAELIVISLPSVIIGAVFCASFLTKYISNIIGYFESMVTVESIHSTTTMSFVDAITVSGNIHSKIHTGQIYRDAVLVLFLIFAVIICTVFCCYGNYKKTPVMKNVSER